MENIRGFLLYFLLFRLLHSRIYLAKLGKFTTAFFHDDHLKFFTVRESNKRACLSTFTNLNQRQTLRLYVIYCAHAFVKYAENPQEAFIDPHDPGRGGSPNALTSLHNISCLPPCAP